MLTTKQGRRGRYFHELDVSEAAWTHHSQHYQPLYCYYAANGWRATSGNLQLAGGRYNVPSTAGATEHRRREGAPPVQYKVKGQIRGRN